MSFWNKTKETLKTTLSSIFNFILSLHKKKYFLLRGCWRTRTYCALQPEKVISGVTITGSASLWVKWKAGIYISFVKRRCETECIKLKPYLAIFLPLSWIKQWSSQSWGNFNRHRERIQKFITNKISKTLKWEVKKKKKRTSDYVLEHENTSVFLCILGKCCCELAFPQAAFFSCWFQWTFDLSLWGGCSLPVSWRILFWTVFADFSVASLANWHDHWSYYVLFFLVMQMAFIAIGERWTSLVRFLKLEGVGKNWDKMEWGFIRLT